MRYKADIWGFFCHCYLEILGRQEALAAGLWLLALPSGSEKRKVKVGGDGGEWRPLMFESSVLDSQEVSEMPEPVPKSAAQSLHSAPRLSPALWSPVHWFNFPSCSLTAFNCHCPNHSLCLPFSSKILGRSRDPFWNCFCLSCVALFGLEPTHYINKPDLELKNLPGFRVLRLKVWATMPCLTHWTEWSI